MVWVQLLDTKASPQRLAKTHHCSKNVSILDISALTVLMLSESFKTAVHVRRLPLPAVFHVCMLNLLGRGTLDAARHL